MLTPQSIHSTARSQPLAAPTPIVALDVPSAEAALELVEQLPRASFYKVGLQLYTAAGPDIVRELRGRGNRVFLDLKLHDIPNTVAGAVRAAAELEVDLLTIHVAGGPVMLRAAVDAAAESINDLRLLGITLLTSLKSSDLAYAWGREDAQLVDEVARLARLADEAGLSGVVSSVHEAAAIREATRPDFTILTPGIRLPGDAVADQVRVATPTDAVRAGVDFMVIGRSVTAAEDPAEAFNRLLQLLADAGEGKA